MFNDFTTSALLTEQAFFSQDFLSDLLSCKISRVTKKFKYEKFSTRSYGIRGSTSGGLLSFQAGVGASIQKAQVLFLGTLSPVWMKTEMRLNMSRVWREQFRKLCSQVQCSLLDTTAWDISIKNIGSLHLEDSLEAKRKRLKQALHEDVSAAAKFGNDVANDLSQELLSTLMDETHEANTSVSVVNQLRSLESITGGLEGSNTKFNDTEPGMHHRISSFGSLDDIIAGPNYSSMQSKAGSGLFDDDAQDSMEWNGVLCQEIPQDSKPSSTGWNGVLCQEIPQDSKPSSTEWTGVLRQGIPQDSKPRPEQVNRVIDSVVKNAFKEGEQNDRFLMKISSFVTSTDLNFQHCDVWAPTQYEGEMCGQVRLVNVGHIAFDKIPSHAAKKLNEFGVYSKTFSFAPGSGLPGRVFGSGQCIWINDVHQATTEEFGLAGGAMMYGVRTAVGFHVSAFNCTLVVILYSTADLVRDIIVENLCINFFRHMNPTLKWHLSIDVANDEPEGIVPQSPETTCHE
eukprot:scaffold5537_cov54-Cyclotella_meneghiniana.AAC.2